MRNARLVFVSIIGLIAGLARADHVPDTSSLIVASSRAPIGAPPRAPTAPPDGAPSRERTERDQPDDVPEGTPCYCTHLLYFRPSDRADQRLDTNGTIEASMRSQRAWFAAAMQRQPRVDRIPGSNAYDISHVLGSLPAASYPTLATIIEELRARGFDDATKRYLVYAAVDRGSTCGEATYPYPTRTGATYAAIYLDSLPCSAREFGNGTLAGAGTADTIGAHEWLHTEGLAPLTAPRHCPSSPYHVCTGALWLIPTSVVAPLDPEQTDVLYPVIDARLSKKILDRERDDYLDHGIPGRPNLRDSLFLEMG